MELLQIRLPDHAWVVAERHKLIPSVYALMIVSPDMMGSPKAVTYSRPTCIAIRSGKHSKSIASTHAIDFENLLEIDAFKKLMHNQNDFIKSDFISIFVC